MNVRPLNDGLNTAFCEVVAVVFRQTEMTWNCQRAVGDAPTIMPMKEKDVLTAKVIACYWFAFLLCCSSLAWSTNRQRVRDLCRRVGLTACIQMMWSSISCCFLLLFTSSSVDGQAVISLLEPLTIIAYRPGQFSLTVLKTGLARSNVTIIVEVCCVHFNAFVLAFVLLLF